MHVMRGETGATPARGSRWRIILDGKSDGPWNMAVDQAIFTSVEKGQSPPTLRFYGWAPPTVSLGYSQGPDDIDVDRGREMGIGVVRRFTGGKAILHDREVTYSLACPIPSLEFPNTLAGSCRAINTCIVRGLRGLDPGLDVRIASPGDLSQAGWNTACFEGPSTHEIVAGGKKLVGSAQRRRDSAFLQHGSLPLEIRWNDLWVLCRTAALPSAPNAIGLRECLGRNIDEQEVISALLKGFRETLRVVFEPGGLTGWEKALAGRFTAEFARIQGMGTCLTASVPGENALRPGE